MKCEFCNERESIIHVQQIMGNDTVEVHLCENCAHDRGISRRDDKIELSLSQLLTGLVDSGVNEPPKEKDSCPGCGMKIEEFRKEGLLGCAECYTSFGEEIRNLYKKISGTTRHQGKIPARLKTVKALIIDREKLKTQLDEAVNREDYEAAAVLRDQIRAIEQSGD